MLLEELQQLILNEKFYDGFKDPISREYVEVFKDPTPSELRSIPTYGRIGEVRCVLVGENAYVWDAMSLHYTAINRVKIPDGLKITIFGKKGGKARISMPFKKLNKKKWVDRIYNHPWLNRNYTEVIIPLLDQRKREKRKRDAT